VYDGICVWQQGLGNKTPGSRKTGAECLGVRLAFPKAQDEWGLKYGRRIEENYLLNAHRTKIFIKKMWRYGT
jgi:hypothetical protein